MAEKEGVQSIAGAGMDGTPLRLAICYSISASTRVFAALGPL